MDYTFDVIAKQFLSKQRKRFSLMFSATTFIILDSTLRSRNHFELNFVHSARYGSELIFFAYDVQMFQHHLMKTPSFLY